MDKHINSNSIMSNLNLHLTIHHLIILHQKHIPKFPSSNQYPIKYPIHSWNLSHFTNISIQTSLFLLFHDHSSSHRKIINQFHRTNLQRITYLTITIPKKKLNLIIIRSIQFHRLFPQFHIIHQYPQLTNPNPNPTKSPKPKQHLIKQLQIIQSPHLFLL